MMVEHGLTFVQGRVGQTKFFLVLMIVLLRHICNVSSVFSYFQHDFIELHHKGIAHRQGFTSRLRSSSTSVVMSSLTLAYDLVAIAVAETGTTGCKQELNRVQTPSLR